MGEVLVEAKDLKKHFEVRRSPLDVILRRKSYIKAVDGIDLKIEKKQIVALVGESGSGKTTTGRLLIMLEKPTSGEIWFDGKRIDSASPKELRALRPRMQMIYQDPYGSLNPKLTVYQSVCEPLIVNKREHSKELVMEMLALAGLRPPERFLERYPYQLSGGQRQRVAIARAMILKPDFVVADEPVSMLDVSLRAEILGVLRQFNERLGVSFLLITHDLAVASQLAERIAVMYLGKIVEEGATRDVLSSPLHPYTQALVSVVPRIGEEKRKKLILQGEIPSARNIPSGCRFHPRCPYKKEVCARVEPELRRLNGVKVACHFAGELS
jgi:peptide/nickel transport system ATP-binding protein